MDAAQITVDLMQNAAIIIVCIVILRMNRDRRPRVRQVQTAGDGSTQIQSGGTIHLGNGHTLTCLGHGDANLCICPNTSVRDFHGQPVHVTVQKTRKEY
jgi:hypothetical protein